MNILMVLSDNSYPPDRRVEREARDLIQDGHNVWIMARKKHGQASEENVNGVRVLRHPVPFEGHGVLSGFAYFYLHRYALTRKIRKVCKKFQIDAIHVHDLPYAFAGLRAGKRLKIPVVFDTHEHYTAMLKMSYESSMYGKYRFLAPIQLTPLKIEEKYVCRNADKTIVVAEEHIPRIEALGARRENIIVVTNTEDIDYFGNLDIEPAIIDEFRGEFVILYTGGFSPHRGLETAIDAMPTILKAIPNARLLLVGDGFTRKEIEQRIKDKQLTNHVTLTGHQPFTRLPSYIQACDIGLIPHISTPHIEMTMPNKIFQFMMFGKPVLVSSTKPMMRIVKDADCGKIFTERDPISLAEKVIELSDSNLASKLGTNGLEAVKDRYNWSVTAEALMQMYRKLSQQDR